MEREPGIERNESGRDDTGEGDWLATYVAGLPPCPGIKFVDDGTEEEDRQADVDRVAGRCVSHELVGAWIDKLGTAGEEPMPAEWLR